MKLIGRAYIHPGLVYAVLAIVFLVLVITSGCASTQRKTYVTCDRPEYVLKPETLQKVDGWICEDCMKSSKGFICYCH